MLAFLAILFIIAVALLIGWNVSRSVPDEAQLGGEYLHMGMDVLFVLIIAMALYGFGYVFAALFAVVLIFVRSLFVYVSMPLSGVALAVATLHEPQVQIIIFVLVLVLNFLVGVTTVKRSALLKRWVWQPAVALSIFLLLKFFPSKPF